LQFISAACASEFIWQIVPLRHQTYSRYILMSRLFTQINAIRFFVLTLAVALIVPALFQDGMFTDGVLYAGVAKNMAEKEVFGIRIFLLAPTHTFMNNLLWGFFLNPFPSIFSPAFIPNVFFNSFYYWSIAF
jgi:hypothetical protein